jgi:CheY-like chemotaxis protein
MSSNILPRPGLVLVDNDVRQLENLTSVFRMSGFSVLAFGCPDVALSTLADRPAPPLDFAVLDYQMPMMNGCVLAQHLRAHYPKLRIILYSGSPVVPENDLNHVDSFVRKGTGMVHLLQEISQLRRR